MNSTLGALGPMPPDDLVIRVGVDPRAFTTVEARQAIFDDLGRSAATAIEGGLPDDWTWDGKAVLDFGCGSGRVLRWMVPHAADGASFAGCDLHEPTVEWLRQHYDPAVRFDVSEGRPLPYDSGSFDLIYAVSVFSHIVDWAPWVLEMHRILRPGGVLVASLHGRGYWPLGVAGQRGVEWEEDRTGIIVEHYGTNFHESFGPAVYVSEWWLREHWGRAFSVVRYEPDGFGLPEGYEGGQGWIVVRKDRESAPTVDELEEPGRDPREARAANRALALAYEERAPTPPAPPVAEPAPAPAARPDPDPELERLRARVSLMEASHSWRATAPLRVFGGYARRVRDRRRGRRTNP